MSRKNITELNALIDASFADNVSGQITPFVMREFQKQFAQAGTVNGNINGHGFYRDNAAAQDISNSKASPEDYTVNKSTVSEDLPDIYTNPTGNGYFDSSANEILFDQAGGVYVIKFRFKYDAGAKNNYIFLGLQEDDGTGFFTEEVKAIPTVSTSQETGAVEFIFRASQANVDNGVKPKVSSDDGSITIFDKTIEIIRLY